MKSSKKSASKIPTTKTNTNKKVSDSGDGGKEFDFALIRKNEFALILGGALVLTLVVFFVFFRTPSDSPSSSGGVPPATKANDTGGTQASLVERLAIIEEKIAGSGTQNGSGSESVPAQDLDLLNQRVSRLETAFSLKFDSMLERLGALEKQISGLSQKARTAAPVPAKKPSPAVKEKTAVKTAAVPKKETQKPGALFHTVKKGETLYSISRKYHTTVGKLRQLNHLSEKADIYPGNNLLVR